MRVPMPKPEVLLVPHNGVQPKVQGFVSPKDHFVRAMPSVTLTDVGKAWNISATTIGRMAEEGRWLEARARHLQAVEGAALRQGERVAIESVASMNERHEKAWKNVVAMAMNKALRQTNNGANPELVSMSDLDKLASILAKAQTGERLARGLSANAEDRPTDVPTDNTRALLTTIYENGTDEEKAAMRHAAVTLAIAQQKNRALVEDTGAEAGAGV